MCALFGDLNTETRFTKLHEKRADALYQSLFLNKRLINPLDPAFQLDPGTGDLPAGETINDPPPARSCSRLWASGKPTWFSSKV